MYNAEKIHAQMWCYWNIEMKKTHKHNFQLRKNLFNSTDSWTKLFAALYRFTSIPVFLFVVIEMMAAYVAIKYLMYIYNSH